MKKLKWKTEQRKVIDLVPFEFNPRTITDSKREQLVQYLHKFNLVEIPAINTDNTIISGDKRVRVLRLVGRGEELIDVRVPNRALTLNEVKEYNLISNTHSGEWDMEMIELEFKDLNLEEFGLAPLVVNEIVGNFEDEGIPAKSQYGVIVMCADDQDQEKVFNELTERGYKCKIVVT